MKLCKEMVDLMNAASPSSNSSLYYSLFKQYCYTAFSALRKSSNLILNLFQLMTDANIPDIKTEPERAVTKVKDRFCLEMSEEDALRYFENIITESVGALFPVFIDRVHGIAQYWRS